MTKGRKAGWAVKTVAQGNTKFIPNRAAIVKMGQNQRLVNLKSSTCGDKWSYSFEGAYG